MSTVSIPIQNPHVTLQEGMLLLNYKAKSYKIRLYSITKIYISNRKTNYLSAILGNLMLSRGDGYKLYICTDGHDDLIIDIDRFDKQQFVNLISWVRNNVIGNAPASK